MGIETILAFTRRKCLTSVFASGHDVNFPAEGKGFRQELQARVFFLYFQTERPN